jgi:hypothetical protein
MVRMSRARVFRFGRESEKRFRLLAHVVGAAGLALLGLVQFSAHIIAYSVALEALPYPENLDHHFVVDPTKFDFYAMDCYRTLADNKMAENLADEVIQASTDFDGHERAPMCLAEARITLAWFKHEKLT